MYLAYDTETGGFEKESSLLTAYFGAYDADFNLYLELDLKLKPDNGLYVVNGEALGVNKIDLTQLALEAIPYKDAKTVLYKFLQSAYMFASTDDTKLIPIGQAIQGDTERIRGHIISEGAWDNFVARRPLDTMMIARFLQINGKIKTTSVSLKTLIEYFDIKIEGNQHEAKYDTQATVKLYQELIKLI